MATSLRELQHELEVRLSDRRVDHWDEALCFIGSGLNRLARAAAHGASDLAGTLNDFGRRREPAHDGAFEVITRVEDPASHYRARAQRLAGRRYVHTTYERGVELTAVTPYAWFRTSPRHATPLEPFAEAAFQRARTATDPRLLLDAVAEVHWWGAQLMPFLRGNGFGIEILARALLAHGGVLSRPWRAGVDPELECLQKSRTRLVACYRTLFDEAGAAHSTSSNPPLRTWQPSPTTWDSLRTPWLEILETGPSTNQALGAVEALGRLGDLRAVTHLERALEDIHDDPMRIVAAEALARITHGKSPALARAAGMLTKMLAPEGNFTYTFADWDGAGTVTAPKNERFRALAARALGVLGPSARLAIPELATTGAQPSVELGAIAREARWRIFESDPSARDLQEDRA